MNTARHNHSGPAAHEAEVHARVHGVPGQFDKVLDGVVRAVEWAKNYNDVVIGASFIIQKDNFHQIVRFTELMGTYGVDNVRLAHEVTPKWDELFTDQEKIKILNYLKRAKSVEDKDFRVFAMVDRLPSYHPKPIGVDQCGYQFFTASLSCDCMFYPCCVTKFNRDYIYGYLQWGSLTEILLGDVRKKLVQSFPYDACEYCYLREKVKFIDYLCQSDPPHVNYV